MEKLESERLIYTVQEVATIIKFLTDYEGQDLSNIDNVKKLSNHNMEGDK